MTAADAAEMGVWTDAETLLLQSLMRRHPATLDKAERWTLIAADMKTKTKKQCVARAKHIAADLAAKKAAAAAAAAAPPPS